MKTHLLLKYSKCDNIRDQFSLLIIVSILTLSCGSNENKTWLEALSKIDEEILGFPNAIIIPGEGCGGCIQNATSVVMSNLDTLTIPVIFTEVGDHKLFVLQMGVENLSHPLIHIDKKNELVNLKPYSIYPRMLKFKNKSLVKIQNYNP